MSFGQIWGPLRTAWFALLLVLALALTAAHVDQFQEILLDSADPLTGHRFVLFVLAIFLAASAMWYFTRALLYVSDAGRAGGADGSQQGSGLLAAAVCGAIVILLLSPKAAALGLLLVVLALLRMLVLPWLANRDVLREQQEMLLPVAVSLVAIVVVVFLAPSWIALAAVGLAVLILLVLVIRSADVPRPEAGTRHQARIFEMWLPRLLGVLTVLPPAVLYLIKGEIAASTTLFLVAAAFLVLVIVRRQGLRSGLLAALVDAFSNPVVYARTERMPVRTFSALFLLLTTSFGLAAALLYWGAPFAQFLGSGALIYLAVASWVAFAHVVLIYPARRFRILPPLLILPVVAYAVGQLVDRHVVRQCADRQSCESPQPVVARPGLQEHLAEWLRQREAVISGSVTDGAGYPVFVIAAEGGGIRAAYWTAQLLASFQDQHPEFHCHIFAVSGVSGGSLGAAYYSSLIAQRAALPEAGSCFDPARPARINGTRTAIYAALEPDYLSPVMAGLLFSDLIQQFIPQAWPDRAYFLETAWEQGWYKATGDNAFARDFSSLWADPAQRFAVPSLLMNTTRVGDGSRHVVTNLSVRNSRPDYFGGIEQVADLLSAPMRLSTAVHMSARFPYLSPAGYLPAARASFVDGGYFENSGARTALDVMRALHQAQRDGAPIQPVVVVIRNSAQHPAAGTASPTPANPTGTPNNAFVRELLAPPLTLLASRSARGRYALQELEDYMCQSNAGCQHSDPGANHWHISLDLNADTEVPLAWTLTRATKQRMDKAIDQIMAADQMGREADELHDWLRR